MTEDWRKKLNEMNQNLSLKKNQSDRHIIALKAQTTREKMRQAKLGSTLDDEVKQKMSIAKKGKEPNNKGKKRSTARIIPHEMRQKISNTLKGIEHSEESNKKRSMTMKGKPKEILTCPHCNTSGGKPQLLRWHFDNCKGKK